MDEEYQHLRDSLRAMSALTSEPLDNQEIDEMGPDLERALAALRALRSIDVSGFEPAFIAPLPRDVRDG